MNKITTKAEYTKAASRVLPIEMLFQWHRWKMFLVLFTQKKNWDHRWQTDFENLQAKIANIFANIFQLFFKLHEFFT